MSPTLDEIYDGLQRHYTTFASIPEDLHLLCPKLNDEDSEDYDHPDEEGNEITAKEKVERVAKSRKRIETTYYLSLLLGINSDVLQTAFEVWTDRIQTCLHKCEKCVRTWHSMRNGFLKVMIDQLGADTAEELEKRLNDFDAKRIDTGLRSAEQLLHEHGPMNSSKMAQLDMIAVLALYDALCCMPYLSEPAHREPFNYVFEKLQDRKPLRVAGIIPTLTFFIFDDDPFRQKFARANWDKVKPKALTRLEWEWSVHTYLLAAMKEVSSSSSSLDRIKRFWDGFLPIAKSMSDTVIVEDLRGMEVQPDVYTLALNHLGCDSVEVLLAIMKAMIVLMRTSPRAFWAAYESTSASLVAEQVFRSPALKSLLAQSLQAPMMTQRGSTNVPVLLEWVDALIMSLPNNRRTEACETILRQLFETLGRDPQITEDGQATNTLTGLNALKLTLSGFLEPTVKVDAGTSLIQINTLLKLVVKYKELINLAAELPAGDGDMKSSLSQTALAVIGSALRLDCKAISVEWNALHNGGMVQEASHRSSSQLWESLLETLYPGRMELAKAMLNALVPLRSIETFRPLKNEKLTDERKIGFNDRYQSAAASISKVFVRLCDFGPADLARLYSDVQGSSLQILVASLIHGENEISVAALDLLKAFTGEAQLSDAVVELLRLHLSPTLDAFSTACLAVTVDGDSNNPWGPMRPLLRYSESFLNALCDASAGLLRSRPLTPAEQASVGRWWETTWQFIDHAFQRTKDWVKTNEKKVLEDFCRTTMELADKVLSEDGLVASVLDKERLSGSGLGSFIDTGASATVDAHESSVSLKLVLCSPQTHSRGLVDMIQLRDKYLVGGIVGILEKLLGRLKPFGLPLPPLAHKTLLRACKRTPTGEYVMRTNLTDQQRAELLKALDEDEDDDDVQIVPPPIVKNSLVERQKKQKTLDFKRGTVPLRALPEEDTALEEATKNLEKRRAQLNRIPAPRPLPRSAPRPDPLKERQVASLKESRAKEKAEKLKRDAEAIAKARALRQGLSAGGVMGKHDTLAGSGKNEILVGSSDEEDEDSSDEETKAMIAKIRSSENKGDAEKLRQIQLLEKRRRPVKKMKVQRSAKDKRARLIPSMDELHKAILEWDIFHEGSDPPNSVRAANVSDWYTDPQEYKNTFLPLLIHEAWRSFVTAKDETIAKPFGIRVQNRLTIDQFLEVTSLMPAAQNRDKGLSEGDMVILSMTQNPLASSDQPHCLARIRKTTFKKDSLEVVYRLSRKQNPIHSLLNPGSEAYGVRITNMTTIEREYAALESLKYYDLMDEVLKAEPSPVLQFGDERIQDIMNKYELNRGQASSILNAKENDGFTLIQGPPGTGKTKTIVAMVGALLTGQISKPVASSSSFNRPNQVEGSAGSSMKKLLICAPSNAAVDELVLRMKQGVQTLAGTRHKINLLRLGRSEAINAAVKDVTLDELVKARMEADNGQSETAKQRDAMHKEAGEIKVKLSTLRPELDVARAGDDRSLTNRLQREVDELRRRQAMIGARIDADKESGNTYAREAEIKKKQIQQDILDRAQVLCATLSGSGHEMFRGLNVEFETVIIDEAAQCVELSALIPLKYGASKCILVGDPKQLPPTVLSQSAARFGYDQSLFVRMQRRHPEDVHLLDRQYRMHPEISRFPSREFYEGKLADGADMAKLRSKPWHDAPLLGPYRFFDVMGVQERGRKGQSLVNNEEIKVAMQLYNRFRSDFGDGLDLKGKIGIITPYKAQLFALRQRFADVYGEDVTESVEFNTTDAFQGRECEIIIFSCVRASSTGGIGFMTDIRRMNVGLTRAKSSLWILGDSRALRQGEFWAKLIEDARQRGVYTAGDVLGLLRKPTEGLVKGSGSYASSGNKRTGDGGFSTARETPTIVPKARETISIEDDDDTAMTDAFPVALPVVSRVPSVKPESRGAIDRPETYELVSRQPLSRDESGAGLIGEFNERGEVVPARRDEGRPVIRGSSASITSSATASGVSAGAGVGQVQRKRVLDEREDERNLPPTKRQASTPSTSSTIQKTGFTYHPKANGTATTLARNSNPTTTNSMTTTISRQGQPGSTMATSSRNLENYSSATSHNPHPSRTSAATTTMSSTSVNGAGLPSNGLDAHRPAQSALKDPSAMQVLGLAPPARPPAMRGVLGQGGQKLKQLPPKKKVPVDPFIKKKPNRPPH